MMKDSIFGRIQFISTIGFESSFMFQEGSVLIVTEISESTYEYFKNHIEVLERISSVIFCLTDKTGYNRYRNFMYMLIKNYNNKILVNFLSLTQRCYMEDSEIIETHATDTCKIFHLLREDDVFIHLEFYSMPEYRILYQIGSPLSDPVLYTGLNGKIHTDDRLFYSVEKHIVMLNRYNIGKGNLSTKLFYDAYEKLFNLNMLNTIFIGYKNNIEKSYFEKKIHELWQPKVEAPATKMNTALEKASETETEYKRLYTENNVRISDFENN